MPFNTNTGIFTPPTGAENAAPGQVIASATWNTVFTDISLGLTQLGQGLVVNGPRVISTPGNFTVSTIDSYILIQAQASTITLPDSTTKVGGVVIMGNNSTIFGSANATVVTTGGQVINGRTSPAYTLTTNYQSLNLFPLASPGGWVIIV